MQHIAEVDARRLSERTKVYSGTRRSTSQPQNLLTKMDNKYKNNKEKGHSDGLEYQMRTR